MRALTEGLCVVLLYLLFNGEFVYLTDRFLKNKQGVGYRNGISVVGNLGGGKSVSFKNDLAYCVLKSQQGVGHFDRAVHVNVPEENVDLILFIILHRFVVKRDVIDPTVAAFFLKLGKSLCRSLDAVF